MSTRSMLLSIAYSRGVIVLSSISSCRLFWWLWCWSYRLFLWIVRAWYSVCPSLFLYFIFRFVILHSCCLVLTSFLMNYALLFTSCRSAFCRWTFRRFNFRFCRFFCKSFFRCMFSLFTFSFITLLGHEYFLVLLYITFCRIAVVVYTIWGNSSVGTPSCLLNAFGGADKSLTFLNDDANVVQSTDTVFRIPFLSMVAVLSNTSMTSNRPAVRSIYLLNYSVASRSAAEVFTGDWSMDTHCPKWNRLRGLYSSSAFELCNVFALSSCTDQRLLPFLPVRKAVVLLVPERMVSLLRHLVVLSVHKGP